MLAAPALRTATFVALLASYADFALGWQARPSVAGLAPWGKAPASLFLQQEPGEREADAERALRSADAALENSSDTTGNATRETARAGGSPPAPSPPVATPATRETRAEAVAPAPAPPAEPARSSGGGDGGKKKEDDSIFEEIMDEVKHDIKEEPEPLTAEEAEKEVSTQLERFLKASGLKANAGGDHFKILATLRASLILLTVCFLAFSVLRKQFPSVYANNVLSLEEGGFGSAPFTPSESFFGWIHAGLFTEYWEAEKTSGTDGALCLIFINFAIQATAWVGVPALVILGPLHFYFGNGRATNPPPGQEADWVSAIGLNNVEIGSWLVWVHCAMVWYVVIITEALVYRTMHKFMPVRYAWLKRLRPPRSTTLLVENIPEDYCTNERLKDYFDGLFPGSTVVESAYVCKKTDKLEGLMNLYMDGELQLEKIRHQIDEAEKEGTSVADLEQEEEAQVTKLDGWAEEVAAEQARIHNAASLPMMDSECMFHGHAIQHLQPEARAVTASSGFVTFTTERLTLLVLNLRCYEDADKFIMSIPPPPNDIIYDDLKVDPKKQVLLDIAGYFFIGLLFYAFIPTIILMAGIIEIVVEAFPSIKDLGLEGVLATLPLQIYLSFLPTLLFLVFHTFFSLKAVAWGQKFLQTVFFTFNILFTVLVTAVIGALANYPGGQGEAVTDLARHPEKVPGLLAENLPRFTHYYLDFMLVRWTTHALELTRYVTLMKYLMFRSIYGDEMAVDLAEPEDQDFYGIGARCTRFALDFLIGLIFCTISPIITLIVICNAAISRMCFGYLLIFAETKKHDLGGTFFVSMLHHVQFGLGVYIALMVGVIARWSGKEQGPWPTTLTGFALLYLFVAYIRFGNRFQWETLPFDEVCTPEALAEAEEQRDDYEKMGDERPSYRQTELYENLVGRHHHHAPKAEGVSGVSTPGDVDGGDSKVNSRAASKERRKSLMHKRKTQFYD